MVGMLKCSNIYDGDLPGILNGDDPYDFNYGYGWIYNESEYDCVPLEHCSSWGGIVDWHEET